MKKRRKQSGTPFDRKRQLKHGDWAEHDEHDSDAVKEVNARRPQHADSASTSSVNRSNGRSNGNGSGNAIRTYNNKYPYEVHYNDHFETSNEAYEDVADCIIDALLKSVLDPRSRKEAQLYDPYYCDGRTKDLLRDLGFANVHHERKDFYKDMRQDTIPPHHIFITNPPYSDQHKIKCLQFCHRQYIENGTPFLLLMPAYVAVRQYYATTLRQILPDVIYLVPSTKYEYDHPEGTGHSTSPFQSLWFCCVGRSHVSDVRQHVDQLQWTATRDKPRIATSVQELERLGCVSTQKRPNPRQRKKNRVKSKGSADAPSASAKRSEKEKNAPSSSKAQASSATTSTPTAKSKSSKYRDQDGQRKRRRF